MDEQDADLKTFSQISQILSDGALVIVGVGGVDLAPLPAKVPTSPLVMVWGMRDGSVLHLEYRNEPESDLYRLLDYDLRLATQYDTTVRTVVLYHSAVQSAPSTLDAGAIQYQVENVYLAERDGDTELDTIEQHLATGAWEPGDSLRLGVALNMRVQNRSQAFERVLDLIHRVPGPEETDMVAAAVIAFTGSSVTAGEGERLRKELKMVSKMA